MGKNSKFTRASKNKVFRGALFLEKTNTILLWFQNLRDTILV